MKHLSLSELFKRIAYDAAEEGVAAYIVDQWNDEDYTEQHSEAIANDLMQYYQEELNRKQKLYDLPLLDPRRLYINGAELRENIEQCEAIIKILKTNTK